MPFTLDSKVALVTGAGRGIGRAIATKLAAAGAAAHVAGDVTAPDFAQTLVDAALAVYGGLDIIVNNAGYTWDNVIQKTTDEQFQAMLDIYMVAPFSILRAAYDVCH